MAFFLLLPGSGGSSFYWRDVVARLVGAGHEAVAVDFPGDDERAGLAAYAELAVTAANGKGHVVVAAQSMGGFTAPIVAEQLGDERVARIVLVNAMIPIPGESAREWGAHTGSAEARERRATAHGYSKTFDPETYFFHDIAPDVVTAMKAADRTEAPIAYAEPAHFRAWPAVPIHVIIGDDDRLFPAEFQERVARERLGDAVTITRIAGGHLAGLSQPELVTRALLASRDG